MEVLYGNFKMYVNIFVEDRISKTHELACCSYMNGARVYLSPLNEANVAIKCFPYENNKLVETFALVLKEYCCLKIASGLGVGPETPKVFGFDIIIF